MTPSTLTQYTERLGLTKQALCLRLGISRATLNNYIKGKYPIPKLVELALKQIEAEEAAKKVIDKIQELQFAANEYARSKKPLTPP